MGEALFELVEAVETGADCQIVGRRGGGDVGAQGIGEGVGRRFGAQLLGIDDYQIVAREIAL